MHGYDFKERLVLGKTFFPLCHQSLPYVYGNQMFSAFLQTSINDKLIQSVSFMICSLKVKCFQETGLKNIVKKNYLALVFFWGKKANIYFEKLEKHFEKCLAPQLITKIFAVSKNACIYVILNGAALHSQTL